MPFVHIIGKTKIWDVPPKRVPSATVDFRVYETTPKDQINPNIGPLGKF